MNDIPHKNHHYLPRGIIKAFGLGKKNQQIFFINKRSGRTAEKTNINNVACINHFYDFEKTNRSLEVDFFGKIDSAAPKIIRNLLQINDISEFNKGQLEELALYVASQICRVPYIYNNLNALATAFNEQISKNSGAFGGGTKDFFLEQIKDNTELYKTLLLKKKMTVCRSKSESFVIGDNPVVILEHGNNLITSGRYTLAIDAKIFMMPISPANVLVFFDELTKERIHGHVSNNNNWQFANSVEYVFGHTKEALENGIKRHYEDAYEYIKAINPSLIEKHNLIKGNAVFIEQAEYSFEGDAIKSLREMV